MIIISSYHLGWYTVIFAAPPIYYLYKGKCAVSQRNYKEYEYNHTLWHLTSPICGSIVLWIIQQKKVTSLISPNCIGLYKYIIISMAKILFLIYL